MVRFLDKETRKLWMPVTKSKEGDFIGILSDSSIDRDEEMMSRTLLTRWADTKALPMLANHENKMQSFVGGWSDFKAITKNKNTALTAKPFFFSAKANPLAQQLKAQFEEAIERGLNPGISIGAIPKSYKEVEIEGKTYKKWMKAEIVEASVVPIQSNRNSYGQIAKAFDLQKPAKLDRCVADLMDDPKFKARGGKTKKESANAVCQASIKDGKSVQEVLEKMAEETKDKSLKRESVEKVEKVVSPSLKKEYLQKYYPTKKMVREQIAEITKDFKEEIIKDTVEEIKKLIVVKKGYTDVMPNDLDKTTDNSKVDPTVENMAKAMSGVEIKESPKEGK